ncbi:MULTISPECIES: hypothetical protein [unclassified Pseudomonas]|uniref:hypothetical protein n=1 Tax=unclassified Pseudomonas TaxID=196821 RepID=UPI0015A3C763|nr:MULTISPECIES: hypothetical protein [unclassified Pseudomonas]NWB40902.1 hypothetical protein [Pseudomonas sp. E6002]NWD65740.1 hypothetical protein [Pseudomonas sp. IPO3774]
MTDNTELKRLAEACVAAGEYLPGEAWEEDRSYCQAEVAFLEFAPVATPAAVLALITERDQLKAENELARMRIKELDLLFGRYILAMRSALIEEEHGKGPAAAMEWIYNSLAGPGELPPEGETDSQAYFDREILAVDDGMQEVMAFHEGRRAATGKGEQS